MGEPTRVLFVMPSAAAQLRFFTRAIEELLRRERHVRVEFERRPQPHGPEAAWLEQMTADPRFSWGTVSAWRRDPWYPVARSLRSADDHLRYVEQSAGERAPYLVSRARNEAPGWARALGNVTGLSGARSVGVVRRAIHALERALPESPELLMHVRLARPDVLLLAPHLMPGAVDDAYLRAAAAHGVPAGLCVSSWDNLSSKQTIRFIPDLVTVWNDVQRREAVELHRVPSDRIAVTGAQCFDQWFDWPVRPREAFLERVGLDPRRPYVLYAGGALFPDNPVEAEWALEWIKALRNTSDPILQTAGILLRPHPKRSHEWASVDVSAFENVAIWPRDGGGMPIGEAARADYFDSLHHSGAVVGLNTSAMIEAAIAGRAVHTILVPAFSSAQLGTFHFRYLLEVGGGLLKVASSLDEHVELLAASLRDPVEGAMAGKQFIAEFVRPHGVDAPATPRFVDAIEGLAGSPTRNVPSPSTLVPLRLLLFPFTIRRRLRKPIMTLLGKSRLELERLRWLTGSTDPAAPPPTEKRERRERETNERS